MLKAELMEILAGGENSGVEFKRDDLRPEQLAKEIVALVNFQGGKIFLGVEDDGSISGIQRANLEMWVMDTVIGRYVHPLILPYYEEVNLENGARVAVITVLPGTAKPYVLRHNDREDIYVRVGSTSRLASREQQIELFCRGGMLHAEVLPVSGTKFSDLDISRLTDYLTNLVNDDEVPQSQQAWENRLCGLGLMTQRQDASSACCTVAGIVLFSRTPRQFIKQAGIRWMAFSGESMEYQALDDTLLDGPLVPLCKGNSSSGRHVIEPGLVEKLLDRIRPFISTESATLNDGFRRERLWDYPADALREALVNAMVHRDWTRSIEVEVVAYSDRLEITSPGAMQNSMTIEKMLAGQRMPKNPIIVEIMRDYGYVDARGMGVRRKIVPLIHQYTGKEALFLSTEDFLRVTLPKKI